MVRTASILLASLLVASTAAAAADATSPPSSEDPATARKTEIQLGLGGGDVPGLSRGYASAALVALLPLGSRTSLELAGASALTSGKDDGGWYWLRLALGLRVDLLRARFRPYVAGRAMHIHMAPTSVWRSHPGNSLAGDSDEGLGHRSGLAFASGFSWATSEAGPIRLGVDLEEAWIPIGHGPRSMTTMLGTVGYAF